MHRSIEKINNLNPVFQNILMGTLTGAIMGYIIKEVFQHIGGWNLVWVAMILIGPLIGYLSGKERLRLEQMKMEKVMLEEDIGKIQSAYKQSTNKFNLVFDNISDAIYLTSEDGRFLLFNEATCMLSGYSREQLKVMQVSQLQIEEGDPEDHRRAWLDNSICRYEDRWKTREGKTIFLDVNSKWIKLTKNQYILHSARDIQRKLEAVEDGKILEIRRFQESKIDESSRANQILFRQIVTPLTTTFGLFSAMAKKYPPETAKIQETLLDWEKVKKSMQGWIAKNNRDLQPGQAEWDMNEVVRQELHHLETVVSGQNIMVNTRFAPEIPVIAASGRDFSIVFGSLFQAAVKMLGKTQKKQMTLVTRLADDQVVVDIQMPERNSFEKHLSAVVDPSYDENDPSGTDRGMILVKNLLDPIRGKMEIVFPEKQGMTVRIKLPVLKGGGAGSEIAKRGKRGNPSAA